eukprot:1434032-Prymnesium_polylepis.1
MSFSVYPFACCTQACFVTPLYDEAGTAKRLTHAELAHRRLRSRTLIEDAICRFPYDLVVAISEGRAFEFGYGHIARLLLLRRALAIIAARLGPVESRRFVGSGQRLISLGVVSLIGLHLYGCCTWLVAARLEDAGRPSWLTLAADEAEGEPPDTWPWWAKYVRAFDRGFLVVLGEGQRGRTHEEVALALAGVLGGTVWLAYFTSTMVQLVANMNASEERARAKIGSVAHFCKHAQLPKEIEARVRKHLEHVLLAKRIPFETDRLLCELSPPLRSEVALHRCASPPAAALARALSPALQPRAQTTQR